MKDTNSKKTASGSMKARAVYNWDKDVRKLAEKVGKIIQTNESNDRTDQKQVLASRY